MKTRGVWLGVAVVLLALSAWLMSRGDKVKSTVQRRKIEFPRYSKPEEAERDRRRRTLPPLPLPPADDEGFRSKRDPMLVALPADPKRSAMVFEVAALKESQIMQVWLDCMLSRNHERRDVGRFKERFGIDLLEDVERVAVSSEKVVVLQGSFAGARVGGDRWTQRTYGEKGIVYENPDNGHDGIIATWGPEMMIAGRDAEPIEDAIDRLESADPAQSSILADGEAYGEAYGVLSPDDLVDTLRGQDQLTERIRELVQRVVIHVDAAEDVAMVADVVGPAGQGMEDLSKSFGAALAVGRIQAKSDGNDKLAELLDYARVQPQGGRFSVDVALPAELLKDLGPCRRQRMNRDDEDDDEVEAEPAP